jgi:hypothetical protein
MPSDYAAKLSRALAEHPITEPTEFELADHGFSQAVAGALRDLGHHVEHHPLRPWITVHPNALESEG